MVVGKIAIVHQGLVHPDEWVCTGRVPDPPLGGIALVGNPDVGSEIIQFIELDHLLRITHDLQDKKISAVGEHKGMLFTKGIIVCLVYHEAILTNKFVLGPALRDADLKAALDVKGKTAKPVLAVIPYYNPEEMTEARDTIPRFQEGGVPVFPTPERAAVALRNALDYYRFRTGLGV